MVHCYLSKGYVYVVGHPTISSTGYYLADGHFYSQNGYSNFYVENRDHKHIYGPDGYTQCYLDGENIYGKLENLPWMK